MAVPDSSSIKLSDVVTELGLSLPRGLLSCFANAVSGSFDPVYSGAEDRLSNFRNYGATPVGVEIVEAVRLDNTSTQVRVNNLVSTSQSFSIKYTLIAVNFSNAGVTNVSSTASGTLLYNVNDTFTHTGNISNYYLQGIYLNLESFNDSCTIRVEILSLGVDSLPSPAFVDINLYGPFPV
jgi:hypothetical protein